MQTKYRATWRACYWGATIQALAINVVPLFFVTLQTRYAVSFEELGRLVLINFATQLLVDFLSLYFVDRVGYRTCFLIAHGTVAAGFVLFGVLPQVLPDAYAGMVLATLVYSVGSGLLEVLISPMADALPSDNKATALTLVHAFYPLGQVVGIFITTVVLWVCGREYWWAVIIAWAVVPLGNLVRGLRLYFPPVETVTERGGLRGLFRSRYFWVALVAMMCAGASEQAMAQWASLFAEQALGVPKLFGDLLGPLLFALFMGIGRFWYGRAGEHIPLQPVLILSAVLSAACYVVAVVSPFPLLALLGCALCGLSVSLMWPGTLSHTASQMAHGGTALFACMAMAGDTGCSLGPWLTGLVSDVVQHAYTGVNAAEYGLKAGLLAAAAFPLMMLVFLLGLRRKQE